MAPTVTLPDLFIGWPFQRTLNPGYESASINSEKWMKSFNVIDSKTLANFNRCNSSLLSSLAYPLADPVHLRLVCDYMYWAFVLDEVCDASDGPSFREQTARLMDIVRNPTKPRPVVESNFESMTISFWSRCTEYAHPTAAERLVESTKGALEAICQEVEDRDHGHVRNIEKYIEVRRGTIGARPAFDLLMLSKDVPAEVNNHPRIRNLIFASIDMIILSNDLYSWNRERSLGLDIHNIVPVVIAEKGLDLQGAIDYVGEWYHKISKKFVEDMEDLPSFSESINPLVSEYVYGLGNWVTANLEWSFECERYFGARGPEIKLTRVIELLPRKLEDGPCRQI